MSHRTPHEKPTVQPLLLRAREAAILLGVSESQIGIWTRQGKLHPIRIPDIRATRYPREEVEELARRWCKSVDGKVTAHGL